MKKGELTHSHLIEGPKRLGEINSGHLELIQRFRETYPSGLFYISPLVIQKIQKCALKKQIANTD